MAFNKTGTPVAMTLVRKCACGNTHNLIIKQGNLVCERCINENQLQTEDHQ